MKQVKFGSVNYRQVEMTARHALPSHAPQGLPPRVGRFSSLAGAAKRLLPLKGFTILEVVGVMAVVVITAAAVTPAILKRIRSALEEKEAKDLVVIADAYKSSVLRTKVIPGDTTWSQAVADELERPLNQVRLSGSQNPRAFLIDPRLVVGTADGKLPYTQTAAGSVKPVNLRLLVLSSIGSPLLVASGTPEIAMFDAIWNTPPRGVPADAAWSGVKGEDLSIQRIELGPLFVRLILNHLDPDRTAMYSIDNGTSVNVPSTAGGFSSYYLERSLLGLRDATGVLIGQEILTKDTSYVFERGLWRGQLLEGKLRGGKTMAQAVDLFLSLPLRPVTQSGGPKFGATPQVVVDEFYGYMMGFAEWSRAGFPDSGSNAQQQVPEYQALLDVQARLDKVSNNLIDM